MDKGITKSLLQGTAPVAEGAVTLSILKGGDPFVNTVKLLRNRAARSPVPLPQAQIYMLALLQVQVEYSNR